MIVYVVIFIFALLGLPNLCKNKTYTLVFVLLLCVIISFRGMNVGTDTLGYSRTFAKITADPNSWEWEVIFDPGFAYLVYFFKLFVSTNPLDCWGAMGIFYVLSFYFLARKYSGNAGLSLILFLFYGSYFIGFNIIRQCFALSLIMCLFVYYDIMNLTRRQMLVSCMVIIGIAYLFHTSMMVFLIIPILSLPIIQRIVSKKLLSGMIIVTFLLCTMGIAVKYIKVFLQTSGLEGQLINYMSHVFYDESGYSILKLALLNGFVLLTIIVSKNTRNIFLLIGVLGIVFLNLFGMIVIELVRIYESLIVWGIIYFAQLVSRKEFQTSFKLYYPIMIILFAIFYFNTITKGYGEITPYTFR